MICDVDETRMLSMRLLKRHQPYGRFQHRDDRRNEVIGYGRNLDRKGVNQTEAEILLQRDIREAAELLAKYPFWAKATPPRRAALIDLALLLDENLGLLGREFISDLEKQDYEPLAVTLRAFSNGQVFKTRLEELADILETGEIRHE